MILLDTSALIALVQGARDGERVQDLSTDDSIAISAVTVNEFLNADSSTDAENLMHELFVLNVTKDVAITTATMERALRRKGRPTSKMDALIAGTAIHHNIPLLTLDKAFVRIPGLNVILPS